MRMDQQPFDAWKYLTFAHPIFGFHLRMNPLVNLGDMLNFFQLTHSTADGSERSGKAEVYYLERKTQTLGICDNFRVSGIDGTFMARSCASINTSDISPTSGQKTMWSSCKNKGATVCSIPRKRGLTFQIAKVKVLGQLPGLVGFYSHPMNSATSCGVYCAAIDRTTSVGLQGKTCACFSSECETSRISFRVQSCR